MLSHWSFQKKCSGNYNYSVKLDMRPTTGANNYFHFFMNTLKKVWLMSSNRDPVFTNFIENFAMKFVKPGCFLPFWRFLSIWQPWLTKKNQTEFFKPPLIYLVMNFVNPGFDPKGRKLYKRAPKPNEIRGFWT